MEYVIYNKKKTVLTDRLLSLDLDRDRVRDRVRERVRERDRVRDRRRECLDLGRLPD